MSETILPGVVIDVRPEGLIVPGAVSIGTIGMVGTAAKGPVGEPVLLSSHTEAVAEFGPYDRWNPDAVGSELTLVRGLEQAYRHGATSVWAVRVHADGDAADDDATASATLDSTTGPCVTVAAASPGTWGNELTVEVTPAEADAVVLDEELDVAAGNLAHGDIVQSARNRVVVRPDSGADRVPTIVYDTAPGPSQVRIDTASGAVTFGTAPVASDTVLVTYTVDQSQARRVIVRSDTVEEVYDVVSGDDLVSDLAADSVLATGAAEANSGELPEEVAATPLANGANGASVGSGEYDSQGLAALAARDAHIIVAAGQTAGDFGDELAAHVAAASSNEVQRERIAIVGSALGDDVGTIGGHSLNSDRVVFVAPGIVSADNGQSPSEDVTLPGAYTAAAVAGKLASMSAHTSPTNKVLPVGGLEEEFSRAELKQLVQSRVLVLESRQGVRITKGITTSTNTAWHQVTTRRIVDYAKYGVRSAATPYIGLLNNARVRAAMRATINSFLTTMVDDEMLVSYELDVSATRDEEIRGIARVDLVLRPTFSIDFIKVTMFLE